MKEIAISYAPTWKQIEAHKDAHRYLLFGGAMGGGKTVFGVMEALQRSLEFPGNMGVMCRRQGTDFMATVYKTWCANVPQELWTVNAQLREIKIKVGGKVSQIMYGGLGERDNADRWKGADLGWFYVDQAEEIEEDGFNMLGSRLRLKVDGIRPRYKGILTANPAPCWLKGRFIRGEGGEEYGFIQSLPGENPHNPSDYVEQLRKLYKNRPELLRAYVEGNWDELEGINLVIKPDWIAACRTFLGYSGETRRVVGVDVARFGDDETVIYCVENGNIVDEDIYGQKSTMETAYRALAMAQRRNANLIAVDAGGVGGGVVDRLEELKGDITVVGIDSASKPDNQLMFLNKRAEIWWKAGEDFANRRVGVGNDDRLIADLGTPMYRHLNGRIVIESKDEIKKRLNRSPDRGDAFVIALEGLRQAKEVVEFEKETSTQKWVAERERETVGSVMSYEGMEN